MSTLAAAVFNLNHPAHTVDWEFIHLSVANVVVIGADADRLRAGDPVALPGRCAPRGCPPRGALLMSAVPPPAAPASKSWTVRTRERAVDALPPEKLLPDGQPTYVASWIYVFGVASSPRSS